MQRRPVSLRKSVPVTAREVILTGHNLKTNLKSMSFPAALLSVHVQARQETLKTYLIDPTSKLDHALVNKEYNDNSN